VARRALLALALAAAPAAMAAELALGTLFHTPEERARLDRMRRGEPEQQAAPAPGGQSVVTGFVKRSDGRNTVWIDGSPVTVRGSSAANVFDPRAVNAYRDREDDSLHIERKPAR
jgi:hypothetical protein